MDAWISKIVTGGDFSGKSERGGIIPERVKPNYA
jgi:hypothetical protein